jgi:hypothetical protein
MPLLANLPTRLQNRISVAEEFGTTPLRILMQIATDPYSSKEDVITCAIAAAPFCHAKLKQIEVTDNREQRDPLAIANDITHLVERLSKVVSPVTDGGSVAAEAPARRPRDLIGVTEGA